MERALEYLGERVCGGGRGGEVAMTFDDCACLREEKMTSIDFEPADPPLPLRLQWSKNNQQQGDQGTLVLVLVLMQIGVGRIHILSEHRCARRRRVRS